MIGNTYLAKKKNKQTKKHTRNIAINSLLEFPFFEKVYKLFIDSVNQYTQTCTNKHWSQHITGI